MDRKSVCHKIHALVSYTDLEVLEMQQRSVANDANVMGIGMIPEANVTRLRENVFVFITLMEELAINVFQVIF